MQPNARTLTLRDYLRPVRERWWLPFVFVLVIAAATFFYESSRPKTYAASTKLFVGSQGNAALGFSASTSTPQEIADQATLLTSVRVAAKVAAHIGYRGSPNSLAGSVSATPSGTTDFIEITASSHSPIEAAQIANGFATEFIAEGSHQIQSNARKAIAGYQQQLSQLPRTPANASTRSSIISELEQARTAVNTAVGSVSQVDPAQPPTTPTGRPPAEYALLAAIAALIGSVLLTYLLHRLDPRMRSIDQASAIYDHPVLAMIPHDGNVEHMIDGHPGLSLRSREAFRELRVALDLAGGEQRFKTILVASASPSEGKTTVARNLALAISEVGRSVALVDADLRRSQLAKGFGLSPEAGLTDVVAATSTLDDVTVTIETRTAAVPGIGSIAGEPASPSRPGFGTAASLTFLSAGSVPPNPPGVTESPAFREVLSRLGEEHDVVVIDTAPITAVSDSIPLLGHVDAIVLVTRSGITDRRSAQLASDVIGRVPSARIVGVVVNDLAPADATAYGAGYGYGYGYGNRKAARETVKVD